jgi:hypothetical protein
MPLRIRNVFFYVRRLDNGYAEDLEISALRNTCSRSSLENAITNVYVRLFLLKGTVEQDMVLSFPPSRYQNFRVSLRMFLFQIA